MSQLRSNYDLSTRKLLESHRLILVRVPSDGNCLFHSLRFFLRYNQISAHELRLRLCSYIASHADTYSVIITESPFRSLTEYLQAMSREGVYGDGTMINAFSSLFQINVVIFNDGQYHETLDTAPVNIALYWDRSAQHYQPAIPA